MLNTRAVCNKNNNVAHDYYKGKLNNTEYTRVKELEETTWGRKPTPLATLTKQANTRKYESRKNICDKCFMAKQLVGEHSCDE